jgi:hypothetical protein
MNKTNEVSNPESHSACGGAIGASTSDGPHIQTTEISMLRRLYRSVGGRVAKLLSWYRY